MPGILHLGWNKGERARQIALVHSVASLAFEDSLVDDKIFWQAVPAVSLQTYKTPMLTAYAPDGAMTAR